jgi:hypothetical protein
MYDCRTCRINGWIEKQNRICFLEKYEQEVPFPVFMTEDETTGKPLAQPLQVMTSKGAEHVWEETDVEGIYDWLKKMENLFPTMPEFKVMQTFMKPVCIEALIEPMIYHYYSLESAAQAYGTDIFSLRKDLYDWFEQIRMSSNLFENLESMERIESIKQVQRQPGKK